MDDFILRFLKLPMGNICDANGKGGNMDAGIKPVSLKMKAAGFAYTVKCHPGDNLAIHIAITKAPVGSILVVDAGGYQKGGHFGEIMATACIEKKIVGLVIDGSCRDADDLEELGWPVFSRGINPGGTIKEFLGVFGDPVICGGILVKTGDMIIGDRDGVVVIAQEKMHSILEAAETIAAKEVSVLERLKKGETTLDIYQFEKIKVASSKAEVLGKPQ
jgi:4-hydroxy-4-methyl-2-oxoglutarate aldolase